MRIVIIGAGIGGLAAAAGLSQTGHDVVVLERATDLSPVGAGISLFANGYRALDVIGVGDRLRVPHDPAATTGQRTPSGRLLARIPTDPTVELGVIHRADLHEQLRQAASRADLRLGWEVVGIFGTDVQARDSSASGEASETTLTADLVVAADGINSRVRASLPDDPGLRYSGYSSWRGLTDEPFDLEGVLGETWGFRERFGYLPLPDGRVYWFGVATMPPGSRFADEAAEVTRRFGHWHEPIPQLLAATSPRAVIRHDISDLARPLPTFVHGRTVLLGDAAHAMTPNLGQGGGQALEDAATLTILLEDVRALPRDETRLVAALAEYDRLRRPRAQAISRQARQLGALAHVGWRPGAVLRDVAFALLPSSALARATRSVVDWYPPTRVRAA